MEPQCRIDAGFRAEARPATDAGPFGRSFREAGMSYKPQRSLIVIALALACSSGAAGLAAACEAGAKLDAAHRTARGAASYAQPISATLPTPRIARGSAAVTNVSADPATALDPARRIARGG